MDSCLRDDTFRQLRNFIYEKSGIFIPDTKKYLIENRLLRRIQENSLKSFEEYFSFVTNSGYERELPRLFDAVTTNETFFFREPQQFDVLCGEILKRITERGCSKNIKIWSAACSTGEEPYTIAMIFKERFSDVRLEIIASDISNSVLESARRGVYSTYSIRNVPQNYLFKYFTKSGESYALNESIKRDVQFRNINLIDEKSTKTIKNVDVIFCRNVLIYFDDKAKKKAVSNLYDCMKQNGYLFIGTSESLHSVTRAFVPVVINNVVVYQKR
jgi:chemotaxis protein methyltransferase CheR